METHRRPSIPPPGRRGGSERLPNRAVAVLPKGLDSNHLRHDAAPHHGAFLRPGPGQAGLLGLDARDTSSDVGPMEVEDGQARPTQGRLQVPRSSQSTRNSDHVRGTGETRGLDPRGLEAHAFERSEQSVAVDQRRGWPNRRNRQVGRAIRSEQRAARPSPASRTPHVESGPTREPVMPGSMSPGRELRRGRGPGTGPPRRRAGADRSASRDRPRAPGRGSRAGRSDRQRTRSPAHRPRSFRRRHRSRTIGRRATSCSGSRS